MNIKKKSWFHKNSIFMKIFVPVIIIMLVQTGTVNMVLFLRGTIGDIEDNALGMLSKNVQMRGTQLESLMRNYWANVGGLELAIMDAVEVFLTDNDYGLEQFLGNGEKERAVLYDLAPVVLGTLGVTNTTGVFMYFLPYDEFSDTPQTLNGLYFRGLGLHVQRGQSTIPTAVLAIRGPMDIMRSVDVSNEALWQPMFNFYPEHEQIWRGFANPQLAFERNRDFDTRNLSYWNAPHLLHPMNRRDANLQITYSRPVIVRNKVVAIVGTDVQVTQIVNHIPLHDLDNFLESGYMLVRFSAQERASLGDTYFEAEIFHMAGRFLPRHFDSQTIRLARSGRSDVYAVIGDLDAYAVIHPLHIHNMHAPFADEQWALIAVGSSQSLFEVARDVSDAVVSGAAIAVLVGSVVLIVFIRNFNKPIRLVIKRIEQNDGTSILADSKIYEIDMLCHTINDMVERRKEAESRTQEERQRYLLALENSTQTFMEFDLANDVLSVYYFTTAQEAPSVTTVPDLSKVVAEGNFMHPDDVLDYTEAFGNGTLGEHECRIQPRFLPHLDDSVLDDGYFWVNIKMRYITDKNGNAMNAIGTLNEITKKKLAERTALENVRRDVTTGFYSRSYGMQMLENVTGSFLMVSVLNFNKMEMAYGRIFGGIFIAEFAHKISTILGENDFAVRFGNDEFLICSQNIKESAIREAFAALYKGGKSDVTVELLIKSVSVKDIKHVHGTPESINVDISNKENLSEVVLELLERSLDIGSSVNLLISVIGRLFALDRVVVLSYDNSFGSLRVTHQWHTAGRVAFSSQIKRVSAKDFQYYEEKLCPNGTLVYENHANSVDTLLEETLCLSHEDTVTLCFEVYENAASVGRILFISNNTDDEICTENERGILQTITKIISTYLNAEKSRSASKAKSLFLSRVSHEIRTPMSAIIGLTNMSLAEDFELESDKGALRENLRRISTSANYMLGLINDVLEMSRVESGKTIQIEEKPFSLTELVKTTEDLMRFSMEERGIRFEVRSNIQNSYVIGDENRLKQVIINLLGNANKFTNSGGFVLFSVEETESGKLEKAYTFTVKDTGIGIPFDRQARIFNPFEQVESASTSGSMQGTGLGLSISKSIITAMKSKIELQSEPGMGSVFSFVLFLPPDANGDKAQSDEATEKYDFTGKKLLLVDDVDINIEIATYILEDSGFIVDTAQNGQEALDKFLASEIGYYDAILMDIQMPVMCGITATREIRKNPREDARTTPIFAVTANAFDEDLKKSIESGMDGHINKPIIVDELLAVLKKFI